MTDDEPIPTRASLLNRLRDVNADASWSEFDRTYRGLIFGVARRAGLTELEAQEVVQDTWLAVAKKVPTFHYRPGADSFKGWLLQLTRWRIMDQFRRRAWGLAAHGGTQGSGPTCESDRPRSALRTRDQPDLTDTGATATVERVADPHDWQSLWEEEWEHNLARVALARIKRRVRPEHYENYHLRVIRERPVSEVRRLLGVSAAQVYLATHRVGAVPKREIRQLERSLAS
jgi:RNA polymerase sigma factor (sigma-70 family)